jgi:hypothetical protein
VRWKENEEVIYLSLPHFLHALSGDPSMSPLGPDLGGHWGAWPAPNAPLQAEL